MSFWGEAGWLCQKKEAQLPDKTVTATVFAKLFHKLHVRTNKP